MGYSIRIGNAEPRHEIYEEELHAWWCVDSLQIADAPVFPNDDTGNWNSRYPSYLVWHNFCENYSLNDLFFNKDDGIMREHSGCFIIKNSHHNYIDIAIKKALKGSIKTPGFCSGVCNLINKEDICYCGYDGGLARLMWLEFWFRWALANCKLPAIYNT